MTRLLLLKAHIPGHQRLLASGKSVTVLAHDDNRAPAAVSIIPAGWMDGKHGQQTREYLRPIPAHDPFAGGQRKWCRVHHFTDDGTATLHHPSGYITKHSSPDAAFDCAEKTIYTKPQAK